MRNLQKFSSPQGGKTIILSIKPKYADLILAGDKTVEFRRVWAAEFVNTIVLYASAPVQKIVGFVEVSEVVAERPSKLWDYSRTRGGGLTRAELFAYLEGKASGFAILLGEVARFDRGIAPSRLIANFSPPQSFRYMTASEVKKLERISCQSDRQR